MAGSRRQIPELVLLPIACGDGLGLTPLARDLSSASFSILLPTPMAKVPVSAMLAKTS